MEIKFYESTEPHYALYAVVDNLWFSSVQRCWGRVSPQMLQTQREVSFSELRQIYGDIDVVSRMIDFYED